MLCVTVANHGKQKVNNSMNMALVAFLIAFGFVTSALVYNADVAIRGKPAGIALSSYNIAHVLFGFVFCMFVGPYIVLERSFTFWRFGGISMPVLLICGLIALLWSFCSGVFVAQLLMISGIVTV